MIENARISILGGGFYHCTPKWNLDKASGKIDQVFSFFLPVSGGALMEFSGGKYQLSPGHVYFLPGHDLVRQTCEKEMGVYWVNFVSESYYLHHRLVGIRAVHSWPLASVSWVEPVFRRMAEFYLPPDKERNYGPVREDLPGGLAIQIEGALMLLTGLLMDATDADFRWGDYSGIERLKPAIDYMDEHYLRNPSLGEIAQQVKLSENYFHRFFKKEAGMTPFKYMENRRLDLARKLLFDRRLNVSEVAEQAGYASLHYFSAAFRRRFGMAPSHLRRGL